MGFRWLAWLLTHPGKGGAMEIKKGDKFPYGDLKTVEGGTPDLSGASKAVFYFYPKDDTPGCTIEARQFTEKKEAFAAKGIRVFGVSADDAASHRAFCDKFGISFPLLMDEGGRVGQRLGNWRGANHARTTVLVDATGAVLQTWDGVKADGHAAEVLAAAEKG